MPDAVQVRREEDGSTVVVNGLLDADGLDVLRRALRAASAQAKDTVIVDLRAAEVPSGPPIAQLCALLRHAGSGGAALEVRGAGPLLHAALAYCAPRVALERATPPVSYVSGRWSAPLR